MDFNSFLINLNSMGFYDFVLPWILFLLIFFGIISKAPFLPEGSKKNQIAIIISSILALFAVNFIPLGAFLSQLFGMSGIYIAGILVVILFLGMGGWKLGSFNKYAVGGVLVLLAILVLAGSGFPLPIISSNMWTLIFVVVLLGAAVLFLEESGDSDTGGKKEEGK